MRKSEKEELIEMLISAAFISSASREKPGIIIERLSKKTREKIRELTSDDFKDLRYI